MICLQKQLAHKKASGVTMVSHIPKRSVLVAIIISSLGVLVNGVEEDMTVSVEPGHEECFFQPLKQGEILNIEYQVIDGGQGQLDISFSLMAPGGRVVASDYKKSDNSHRYEISDSGDYRICFDNRFSTFNSKTVFFEVLVETEDDYKDPWGDLEGFEPTEESYEITVQDIEETLSRVKTHLVKIKHMQEAVRAVEARDRNIAEGNYLRVNYWSMVQILVMIIVGFIQVVMVKSLFDEQSKIHKIWKKNFGSYR